MSKVIRKGVFETNSSSTHSICVTKEGAYTLPQKMAFVTGKFGWEVDELRSVEEKASYLYTGLIECERGEQIAALKATLAKSGVTATFTIPGGDDSYVDHGCELQDFLDAVMVKDELFRFLFSDRSFILTGNDNGGYNKPKGGTCATHTVYYKGN